MRAALFGLAIVAGLGACGRSEEEKARSIARLERELRQKNAAEQYAFVAPLETRTGDFEKTIAEVEEFQARQERIRALQEQLGANAPR